MEQIERIRAALNRLLERQDDDAFVIVEDKMSGKFVQFAGNAFQDLIFDLPGQALDSMELTRANILLRIFDISFEEWDVYDEPGGNVIGRQTGFCKSIGRDADFAAQLAWKVLTEVYALKEPIILSIEENLQC